MSAESTEVQKDSVEEVFEEIKDRIAAPILLLIALGGHTVFFGIAIGLEDNKDELITMIIACLVHKWAAAMALVSHIYIYIYI